MQLRPRDGNGRAITSKDGLIRDFKKIIDRDQLDPMPEVPVKGGQMYYFKTATDAQGKQLTKIVPYDAERNKEKKVPKFKSNYVKVNTLVKNAAPSNYNEIRSIRKLYVDTLKAISSEQFERMLKEHGVIEKVEPGDNTTDHADLKKFVTEAIDTYKEVHPNRAISLSSQKYKEYIQKVLERVREQYYIDVDAVVTFNSSTNFSEQQTIAHAKGKITNDATTASASSIPNVAIEHGKVDNKDKMNAANKILKIIGATAADNTTALTGSETLTILNPLTLWSQEREDLVALINELYKIFVEQTRQQLKEKPELGFQFSDGGKKKGLSGKKAYRSGKRSGKKKGRKSPKKH